MSVLFLESISVSILILFILSASGQNRGLFVRGRRPLPIDGHWNSWGPWSECYLNSKNVENFYPSLENFQIQNRNRSCDNPKPINGGEDCEPPTHRFKQCSCMNPLGMETKLIADSQISSTPHFNSYSASQGRIGDEYNGWCSNVKESHFNKIYLEIDFGKFANVGAIEMEGSNKNGRVTRYSLEYSLNGKDWENIIPKNGFKGKFKGNLVPGRSRANFSQHRVMKYLRVIPLKSYGDYPCLKIEPFGCTFTCGEVLTSDYGKISGNSRVDIDQNCLWRIEVLNTSALSFDFTIFDILCEHGYLNIHDGYFDFIDSPVIERLCLKNRDQDFNHLLKINTNKVWLNFVSNSSDYEDGFTLKYFGECKQTINLIEGKPNKINSPNFPNEYFGNMDCMWNVNAAQGVNSIDIIFNDFSIESTSKSCLDDTLTINYYQNEQENLLGVFCNDNIPKMNYSLLADRVSIHFKTDSISSDRGFSILIQSGKKLPPTERNMIPENPTSSIETTLTSESTFNNDTFGTPRKDKKEDSGSDWTIITISAFSAIVVLLLIWVIGNNLRRFINNRNEVEAHCAKVKAKNEEKILQEQKRASQAERYSLIQSPKHDIVMVSPKHTFSPSPVKTMSPSKMTEDINDEELHDSVDGELSHLMSTPEHNSTISKHDTVSPVSGTHSLNSPAEAEVDLPKGYNGSVQVQSPSKLNSTSDVSFKEGNNNSDIESCV